MRDYEELVEALRLCVRWHRADDALANAEQAANAIEELASNADKFKWISVEERLPKFDQKVLWVKNKDPEARFNHDGIYIAELKDRTPEPDPEGKKNFWGIPGYDSEWTVWAWSYFSEPEVTHWMPLPEPPAKEDANA